MRRFIETLARDFAGALRTARTNPGVTAVVVISIALAMAANTTMFCIMNGALFGSLPVSEPERLVSFGEAAAFNHPDYVEYSKLDEVFEGVSARFMLLPVSLGGGDPERIWGQLVSGNYFDVLGLQPALGRSFLPDESDLQRRSAVVILSHSLWARRFGADQSILGSTVIMNNRPFTVIGVMPPGFRGEDRALVSEFWMPLGMTPQMLTEIGGFDNRSATWLFLTGRLKPEVSRQQAQAAVNVVKDRIDGEFNKDRVGKDPMRLTKAGVLPAGAHGFAVQLTSVLMIVTGLVLLIACANVANVLMARAVARRKEVSVRLALGATRWRLIRQLLTESLVLASFGALAGLALAYLAARAISTAQLSLPLPISFNFSPDARVLLFTLALTAITGVIFGLLPALRATKPDLVTALKDQAAVLTRLGRFGITNALVVMQVSLCLVLLISAGLFLRSLRNTSSLELGMRPDKVLLVGFDTKLHSYTPARSREFLTVLRERLSALPGTQSVSFMDYRPFTMAGSDGRVRRAAGRDNREEGISVAMLMVGSRYFETLGIPVLRGRDFDPARDAARELVIINELMAQRLCEGDDPIGQTIEERIGGSWPDERGKPTNTSEIVGVVGNTQLRWLGEETRPAMYRLIDRHPDKTVFMFGTTVLLKTARPPGETVPLVRAEFRALDPNLAVFDVETMDERVSKALMIPRVSALLLAVFGTAGLALAMVGLYGVLSYSVRRRTREIGIRMALGAQVSAVLRSVVGQGLAMAGIGLALGLALAAVMGRLFSAFLYGVSPIDPWTFTIVPVALLGVALAAAWTPARRSARIAPSTALRHD